MKLPDGWNEASPGGLATNAHPLYGGIVDRQIVDSSWFVVFNEAQLDPIEALASREAAFAAFHDALHAYIAGRMARYADLSGCAEGAITGCMFERLVKDGGSTDAAHSVARGKCKAIQDLPPEEQIKAALDGGVAADRLAGAIWGENATWASVRTSYERPQHETAALWDQAGFEIISTGGGFWAAAITVEGVNFLLTDYSESRTPNPDYSLNVGGYKAETGDYLDFSVTVESLQDAMYQMANWAASLQDRLHGAEPASKAPGLRL